MKENAHLPIIGVGPLIVVPQLLLTTVGIIFSVIGFVDFGKLDFLKIPFMIIGIALIISGVYLWYCANFKDKIDNCITENKLITSGSYSVVRNPIYSAFFLICVGAIFLANNLILFLVPMICWAYMTVMLKNTEEKWLYHLYGKEYSDYCKRVNRCIPWFTKRDDAVQP